MLSIKQLTKKLCQTIAQGVTLNVALDGASFADTVAGTAGSTAKPTTGGDSVASILAARMIIINAATAEESGYGMTEQGDSETSNFPGTVESEVCTGTAPDKTCTTAPVTPDTFLFFNDGIMFAYKAADAKACTDDETITGHKKCVGVIDVNGTKGPNKVVACDAGTGTGTTPCVVSNPTDIYPVEFYDQTILPASDAARAVLYGK